KETNNVLKPAKVPQSSSVNSCSPTTTISSLAKFICFAVLLKARRNGLRALNTNGTFNGSQKACTLLWLLFEMMVTLIPYSFIRLNHSMTSGVASLASYATSVLSKSVIIPLIPCSNNCSGWISKIRFTNLSGRKYFSTVGTSSYITKLCVYLPSSYMNLLYLYSDKMLCYIHITCFIDEKAFYKFSYISICR